MATGYSSELNHKPGPDHALQYTREISVGLSPKPVECASSKRRYPGYEGVVALSGGHIQAHDITKMAAEVLYHCATLHVPQCTSAVATRGQHLQCNR